MSPSDSEYPKDYYKGMCELCHQSKMIRWDMDRNLSVCDECDAHFFCIECGKKVLPDEVAEEIEFGLYLAIKCKHCVKNQAEI